MFIEVYFYGSNWKLPSAVSDNGLAPNRRQAIIWTNADPIDWRVYAALGGDELKQGLTHCGRNNGRHFPDDIFKYIFLNENVWISTKFSLKYVPMGPINNILALVQMMAWQRIGFWHIYASLGLNGLKWQNDKAKKMTTQNETMLTII